MNHHLIGAASAALVALSPMAAQAQAASSSPTPIPPPTASVATAPAATAPAPPHVLASGTVVSLEIAQSISSRTLKRGDKFAIRLAEPITLGSQVIVPAGTPGVGQVVDVKKSGMAGASGKLVLAARYLDYKGQQIPLRTFRFGRSGVDRTDTAMVVGSMSAVVGILIKGGEVDVANGAKGEAKLAADIDAEGHVLAAVAAPAAAAPIASPAA